MKNANTLLIGAMLSLVTLMPLSAVAQAAPDAGKAASTTAASMTDGEVRKIDKDAGKITIKHGDIKHLEMPGMTMVFAAKDKALLDKAQVGDKIRFDKNSGTVQSIGLMSTRIRSFVGEELIFSNKQLLDKLIENLSLRHHTRTRLPIGVAYETPVEKLEALLGQYMGRFTSSGTTVGELYLFSILHQVIPPCFSVFCAFSPGPRNSRHEAQEGRTPPFVRRPGC